MLLRSRALIVALIIALLSGACASTADVAVADEAQPEPAATATAIPEPTAVPEPTAIPDPTPVPTPEPEPTATPVPEPTATPESGYDFSAVSSTVAGFVDNNDLNGAGLIVVHRDDGVIHHEHWGEFNEDRISLIASSSKMVTAGVLLRLQDDGVLDIDAPIADYVEWGAGNPDITTAQLLSNSSGLVGLLPNPGYEPYVCQYDFSKVLQDCAEAIFTTTGDDEDITAPDVAFNYGGAQWQVAGAVAEVVSGQTWNDLIQNIYVQPCGLETFGYNNHFAQLPSNFVHPEAFDSNPAQLADTANPNMEGGAYTTTGDYGKLLLMQLRGGECDGNQVLSQEALDIMHNDRISDAYEGNAGGSGTGYGMGWWINRETERISDGGAYGSVPWLDLDDGYGVYLVIEADSGTGGRLAGQLYDVVHAAVTAS